MIDTHVITTIQRAHFDVRVEAEVSRIRNDRIEIEIADRRGTTIEVTIDTIEVTINTIEITIEVTIDMIEVTIDTIEITIDAIEMVGVAIDKSAKQPQNRASSSDLTPTATMSSLQDDETPSDAHLHSRHGGRKVIMEMVQRVGVIWESAGMRDVIGNEEKSRHQVR